MGREEIFIDLGRRAKNARLFTKKLT